MYYADYIPVAMDRKSLIIGVVALLILVIVISVYVKQTRSPTEGIDTTAGHIPRVEFYVIDKTTGDPIENAIVYLGGGDEKYYTDSEGKCSKDLYGYDYSVGVFKKGYNRYEGRYHFETRDYSVTIELEKKSEIPTSFTIEGRVIEVVTAEGTRSENHFYKIKTDDGNEEYLFDEIGRNIGFEEFVNERVSVTGFKEIGFIGWQHDQAVGIYVESIE